MPRRLPYLQPRYNRNGAFDPGTQEPLAGDGGKVPDRRKVSLNWLAGTILTGLAGSALMGGAVYAALDGEYTMATAPVFTPRVQLNNASQTGTSPKRDRLITQSETMEAHQVIRVSTTTKVGNKDIIKVKPFAHVLASLEMSAGSLAAQVPAYNPQSLAAAADSPVSPAPAAVPEEVGEVTVVNRDLGEIAFTADTPPMLPYDQVLALTNAMRDGSQIDSGDLPQQLLTLPTHDESTDESSDLTALRTTEVSGVGDSALNIKIVPENFTNIEKSTNETGSREQTIQVKDNETLTAILVKLGSNDDEIEQIISALGNASYLHTGIRLRVLVAPGGKKSMQARPVRISVYNVDKHLGTAVLADNDEYVSVQDPMASDTDSSANIPTHDTEEDDYIGAGIQLYNSIYETALKQQVPTAIIENMLRIYAYDVDLTRRTRPGDNFEVFYELDEAGKPVGDVLYTSLSIDGETRRFYRFQSPDDGTVDYYDADGRSARKFLLRKPLKSGELRSTFGMRRHPILGYYKMHTGVDWSDRIGTPLIATGNGTIIKAGWTNGYGRHIEIQHANGYVSTYSHLSAFTNNTAVGATVTMGQVIGYLGQSGLATGPHIHYELKINGSFVDPMRIKLPQGKELNPDMLSRFNEERNRIDSLMKAPPVAEAATGSNKT